MFSLDKVREAIVFMIALVLSITVHEFAHALAADRLGDRTPRYQGRVTLNPLAHMDLLGTVIFPLAGIFLAGGVLFGWGRPVMVNPLSFTRKLRMKTSHMLVAAAGPASNILFALLVSIILLVVLSAHLVPLFQSGSTVMHPIAKNLVLLIQLNLVLAAFNLIPCPPLDGGTVLAGLLPDQYSAPLRFLQQYGMFILLALLMTRALDYVLWPVNWLSREWLLLLVRWSGLAG